MPSEEPPSTKPKVGRGSKTQVTEWTKWLKAIRVSYAVDQEEFGQRIGRTRSAVGMWETGQQVPPAKAVAAILTGFPEAPPPPGSAGAIQIKGTVEPEAIYAKILYAGVVPASNWGDALNQAEPEPINPKFAGPKRFMCRVQGDSCYPALHPGDLIIFEQNHAPAEGMIVLAERSSDSACTVKEFKRINGVATLAPINPDPQFHDVSDEGGWRATAYLVGVIFAVHGAEAEFYSPTGLRVAQLLTLRRTL